MNKKSQKAQKSQMALSIGYDLKLVRLKSDAVPTIFQRVKYPVKRKNRSSTALEKRQRIEVHRLFLWAIIRDFTFVYCQKQNIEISVWGGGGEIYGWEN